MGRSIVKLATCAALLGASALAPLSSALAEPVALLDWGSSASPPMGGTAGSLQTCPDSPPPGQKARSRGMYGYVKYGAPQILPAPDAQWQKAAECAAGPSSTPSLPPVIASPEPDDGGEPPLPPPGSRGDGNGVVPVAEVVGVPPASVPPTTPGTPGTSNGPGGQGETHAVPEPASGLLLGVGLLGIWAARRRR